MIEDKVLIDFARLSDATEIGVLSKNDIEFGLGWKYTPKRLAEQIRNKSKNVVVARVGSAIAGFGIMTYHTDQANLDLLGVKREYRRLKIGTQIVQWLEKVAITAGCFNIYIQVRAENIGAIKFYKRLGYSVLGKHKGYYRGVETGVIMVKSLRRMFTTI